MLTGVCPGCGLRADLDVFCAQAEVKQALAAALTLPPSLAGRVLRYLRLFSPPSKTLALGKTARLLTGLAETTRSAQVTRRGVTHAAPVELWGAALDVVLDKPPETLPLTSHGYLLQVAWNLAERSAVRREQTLDERLRQGRRPSADAAEDPPAPASSLAGAVSAPSAPLTAGAAALSSSADALTPDSSPRWRGEKGARVGPPADFKALAARLIGVGQFSSTPTSPSPSPPTPLPEGEGMTTTPTPIPEEQNHD